MTLSPEFNKQVSDGKIFYHFTTDIGFRVMQGESPATIVSGLGDDVSKKDKTALLKALKKMSAKGPGLQPANFFVQWAPSRLALPRKGRKKVIEGILVPAPESWTNTRDLPVKDMSFYQHFVTTLTSSRRSIVKKYAQDYRLLKVTTAPEDDINVADIAELVKDVAPHLQSEIKGLKGLSVTFHAFAALQTGAKKYWQSLAPFAGSAEKNSPALPVVVCWTPIPAERIEVVQTFSPQEMKELKDLHWVTKPKSAPVLKLA